MPEALAVVSDWQPAPMQQIAVSDQSPTAYPAALFDPATVGRVAQSPTLPVVKVAFAKVMPLVETWAGELSAGETLDELLAKAHLSARARAEVALAMAAEYDLRRLKPGYGIEVETTLSATLRRVALSVDAGVRIEVTFSN